MYVRIYVLFTCLRTGLFNRVWWLQTSHYLTVDIVEVSKLGVHCFFRIIGKGSWKIKGVMGKKKISGVFISSLSLSISLSLSFYLSLFFSIYIYLCLFHSLYSLFLCLSPFLPLKFIVKNNGPPIFTPYRRRPGAHRDN